MNQGHSQGRTYIEGPSARLAAGTPPTPSWYQVAPSWRASGNERSLVIIQLLLLALHGFRVPVAR